MKTLRFGILVITFCSAVLCVPNAFAQTTEPDTNRPGMDYKNFDQATPDPGFCQSACGQDVQCRAWTYVKPGVQGPSARCWLKSGTPQPVNDSCCVSGVTRLGQISHNAALSRKALKVSAAAAPESVAAGQKATITVRVQDEKGQSIPGATATISAGGGKFLSPDEPYDATGNLQGPYTATGLTDTSGVFTASWVCSPCAGVYTLSVEGAKNGLKSTSDLTIQIKQ